MSDAYDLFVINLVKNVLFQVYPLAKDAAQNKALDTSLAAAITTAALVGAIFGQLTFGFFADYLGRRVIFITTISLVILGSLGSATCSAPSSPPSTDYSGNVSVYYQLVFWRLLLGFGVGGEYPLSATISAESNNTKQRGTAVASVFSMQGVGNLLASVVMICCLRSSLPLDVVWRIALGIGALPGICTVYWRYRMEESHHFTAITSGDVMSIGDSSDEESLLKTDTSSSAVAAPAKGSFKRTLQTIWEFRWTLLGTAGNWLIFDIVFYGNGLFSSTVLTGIGYGSGSLEDLAIGNAFIGLIGLPGYFVALATIDRLGRKNIQIMGFVCTAIVFLFMAIFLDPLEKKYSGLFIFLYGLTFFFANFGPNMSTFVIPSEAFPTRAKATCHGISAASGKVGAAIGSSVFPILLAAYSSATEGVSVVLYVCAALSVAGLAWTLIFTKETGELDIEAMDRDNEVLLARLASEDKEGKGGGGGKY
jgi:PHS family inorganic phosphate transporter-like MFS transporter